MFLNSLQVVVDSPPYPRDIGKDWFGRTQNSHPQVRFKSSTSRSDWQLTDRSNRQSRLRDNRFVFSGFRIVKVS